MRRCRCCVYDVGRCHDRHARSRRGANGHHHQRQSTLLPAVLLSLSPAPPCRLRLPGVLRRRIWRRWVLRRRIWRRWVLRRRIWRRWVLRRRVWWLLRWVLSSVWIRVSSTILGMVVYQQRQEREVAKCSDLSDENSPGFSGAARVVCLPGAGAVASQWRRACRQRTGGRDVD